MTRELLLDAARHRIGHGGLPDRETFGKTAMVVGWSGTAPVHARPGTWVELCEAVDAADRLRDGADLDEWVDVDRLRMPLNQYRDHLQRELDQRVDSAVAVMLGGLPPPG